MTLAVGADAPGGPSGNLGNGLGRLLAPPAAPGVASVAQALKPYTKVGRATSQGVQAQRVDRVPPGIDGRGITVGALSDSFDTATESLSGGRLKVHAADDIRTGDLPAEGVTVIEDDPSPGTTDEGRAMLQIIHDVAPRAKECFATAEGGQVNFANNIRALAARTGPCKADVVVDDVGYFGEPVFGDGVISDAVDDVTAQGVQYFSSAGNGNSQQAYAAPLRLVGTDRPGDGSNIKLSRVDPSLYQGGFQDFDPGAGVDVAMDQALGFDGKDLGTGIVDLQWDDPVDPNGAVVDPTPKFSVKGEITAAAPVASIPVRRHRRRDDPRPRRCDPVGRDGLHPHAEGSGRHRPAGGRHRHEPGDDLPDAPEARPVHVRGVRLQR